MSKGLTPDQIVKAQKEKSPFGKLKKDLTERWENLDKGAAAEKGFDWILENYGKEEDGSLSDVGQLASIGKYASAGSTFGVYGAIAGGLYGAVSGIFTSKKAKREYRKKQKEFVRNVGKNFIEQAEALSEQAEGTYRAGDSLVGQASQSTSAEASRYGRSAYGVENLSEGSGLASRRQGAIGETSDLVRSSVSRLEGLAEKAEEFGSELRWGGYQDYEKSKSYTAEFKRILEDSSNE